MNFFSGSLKTPKEIQEEHLVHRKVLHGLITKLSVDGQLKELFQTDVMELISIVSHCLKINNLLPQVMIMVSSVYTETQQEVVMITLDIEVTLNS
jgi:hypothetical protein